MLEPNSEGYYKLSDLAQYFGIKKNTLYRRFKRKYYSKHIPIKLDENSVKKYQGKIHCSNSLTCAIMYEQLQKMNKIDPYISVDKYGYWDPKDFENNFKFLKKKLVNDLKSDDRYTRKTQRIINNIDSLVNMIIQAYKMFEPNEPLEKGTIAVIVGDQRLIAKRIDKNQKNNFVQTKNKLKSASNQ